VKIAIFHNYLDNIGGAERLTLTLARELNADVYTTNIDRKKLSKMGFSDIRIKSVGKVPVNAPFRQQLALFRFLFFKAKGYDFHIITGDWAVSAAVRNKPNLWYVHAPTREIWDLYEFTKNEIVPRRLRVIFVLWVHANRMLSRIFVRHAERIVCNSGNTKKRVIKYLKRSAEVVHPPVDVARYSEGKNHGYWLSVNRLVKHKRIEMQLETMKILPGERLVIVGSYEQARHFIEYKNYLETIKPENVRFMHFVTESRLRSLYSHCKGFITTSMDEDFGLTAVEAMAAGKPVIAPDEGGFRESVINGETGVLIRDINPRKLADAIKNIEHSGISARKCRKRAEMFSVQRFMKSIRRLVYSE